MAKQSGPDIRNWIIELIAAGELTPDTPLPTRHEIMRRFGVARATVDRVIGQLAEDGVVTSRRGAGTFAVQAGAAAAAPHLFIVTPDTAPTVERNVLGGVLAELGGRSGVDILAPRDAAPAFGRMVQPGARVVWDRPRQEEFALIAALDRCRVSQVLINRRHPAFNFVCTDTAAGLASGLGWMRRRTAGRSFTVGMLVPPLDPTRPFWAEREILFHEELYRQGLALNGRQRVAGPEHEALLAGIRAFLAAGRPPELIFVPELHYVRTLLTVLSERGIVPGRDVMILMTDFDEGLAGEPGVIALEQPFQEMQRRAVTWLLQRQPGAMQELIPPRLRVADQAAGAPGALSAAALGPGPQAGGGMPGK